MIKKFVLTVLMLLVAGECFAANDFSGDTNCVALWRFESGALTTDSKGTNTLTADGSPASDTVTYKEGSGAVTFDSVGAEGYYVNDASLDSGFPLKNGDANKKISVCCWFYLNATNNFAYIAGKYDSVADKRSLLFLLGSGGTSWWFALGYNSGASIETLYSGGTPTTGRWYHLGYTYQDSDKSWKLVLWDDTASSKVIDTSGTATNNINIEDGAWQIAADCINNGNYFDGNMDELVVFKDILSTDEIDQIRAGTYTATAASSGQVIMVIE